MSNTITYGYSLRGVRTLKDLENQLDKIKETAEVPLDAKLHIAYGNSIEPYIYFEWQKRW